MNKQSSQNEFIEYIKEVLEPLGVITVRHMFGGFGIYKSGLMFALVADQELYFKADTVAAEFFQSFGSEPFVYETKGRKVSMSYWRVVPEVLDEHELMNIWFEKSYNAAVNAKQKSKP